MHPREVARRLAILSDVWQQIPAYARRYASYSVRSRLDLTWLDAPRIVQLSAAVGELSLEVVTRDEIGRFLYVYGLWDLLGTRLVQRFLRPGMTVLDVGANIGYYSLIAALQVGSGGVVHSFEPHDEIRGWLARNVTRNGLQNIIIRSEAVTNQTGEVRFYRSAEASNQGISSTVEGPALHGDRREASPVVVPAMCLDDVVNGLGCSVDLIKLDVEGAERVAFEGGERLLSAADAPLVLFESYELGPTAEILGAYGFQVRRLSHHWRHGLCLAQDSATAFQGEPNYVAYKQHHKAALTGLV